MPLLMISFDCTMSEGFAFDSYTFASNAFDVKSNADEMHLNQIQLIEMKCY